MFSFGAALTKYLTNNGRRERFVLPPSFRDVSTQHGTVMLRAVMLSTVILSVVMLRVCMLCTR